MEGSSSCCCCNGSSCVMDFGDNSGSSSASCSPNPMMLMMMPLLTTATSTCHHAHAHHHPHPHLHVPHHPNPINPIPNPININNDNININNNNNNLSPYYTHLPMPIHIPIPSSTNTTSAINTLTNSSGLGPLFMDKNNHGHDGTTSSSPSPSSSVKAKIMAHPHYHRLLAAYVNCQKVGAPPEAAARLEEACASAATMGGGDGGGIGEDPALDQFMEAYCEMLTKYEQELSKPFKEAMHFLHSIESQFKALTISSSSTSSDFACGEATDRNGSSEEDADVANDAIDPLAEDRELKGQLLRKYSGYLGSLKQEFMKKRKKGKLPKEARQQLLDWWSRHYKWPYPSESQKVALAESTGLDQKQINNWFINQRKRHWKPSEDMQFMVMDPSHPHHYYMDAVLGNPYPMI